MRCLLPALAFATLTVSTLVACNDATPPSDATAPVADASPADAPAPLPDGDTSVPPVDGDGDGDVPTDDDANNTDEDVAGTIPARFLGEWNKDAAACGSASNDSRLVIATDTIRFHESSGPVQSATVDGNELTVVARLTGEGETRDATYRFRLSADGATLTDADSGLARQRCG